MSSHDKSSNDIWAAFYASEPKAPDHKEEADNPIVREAALARQEARYQEVEIANAILIHRVLGLPESECPHTTDIDIDSNIRNIGPFSEFREAKLLLQPDRRDELIFEGMHPVEAAMAGSPYIIYGNNMPNPTKELIRKLLQRTAAVHDSNLGTPDAVEIWAGKLHGLPLDLVFHHLEDSTDDPSRTQLLTLDVMVIPEHLRPAPFPEASTRPTQGSPISEIHTTWLESILRQP